MKKYIIRVGVQFLILFIFPFFLVAQAKNSKVLFEINELSPNEMATEALILKQNLSLQIEAQGLFGNRNQEYAAYGWILDGDSRRIIWDFSKANIQRKHTSQNISIEDEITLPAGYYEIYFIYLPLYIKKSDSFYRLFLKQSHDSSSPRRDIGMRITCLESEESCTAIQKSALKEDFQTIVQMIETVDNSYNKEGFSLSGEMDVRIYAIGEGNKSKREMYDYAWITDANTRERVWEMTTRNTEPAGGGEKNLKFDDIITLPKGDYLVYYVTDDSHSFESWNVAPPEDPRYWGITIWGASIGDKSSVVKSFHANETTETKIVEITRIRNDEVKSQSFSLKRASRLRIYTLGESSGEDEMADYGWIIDAHTREKAWELRCDATQHAGGSRKNRLFDGCVTLPAGDYVAYYQTDDSHAYRSWNEGPPYDPTAWGITIWGTEADFESSTSASSRNENGSLILSQIIRVGNDDKIKEKFTLSSETTVKIYALGEGDRSEMYDYGWIENAEGKIVWKMRYQKTEHAGGATKNRQINDEITLEPGTYYAIYQTDDSHAFQMWNMQPPDDPENWGITVTHQRE